MNPPRNFFQFEKKGILFDKPEEMPYPGPYYPCLIKMNEIKEFPFDFALYFSTDHHRGKGGIWLYICDGTPSDPKNWKSYDQAVADGDFDYLKRKPRKNPIYIDRRQGLLHMETPYANVINGTLYLTYHKQSLRKFAQWQPTLLSISDDGINFYRIHGNKDSIILKSPSKKMNQNLGYFRWGCNPFHHVEYTYIGYSLLHGGKNFQTAMWGSHDAVKWNLLQIFACLEGVGMNEEDKILNWHTIDPKSIQRINEDEYVMLADASTRAWGSQKRTTELYEIFIAGDGKTIKRKARKILRHGLNGSADSEEVATPSLTKIGDTIHLIYIGSSKEAQLNTVMSAIGKFNFDARLSEKLTEEEQQRNFY